jgi:DNA-binding response OmpR family regulator
MSNEQKSGTSPATEVEGASGPSPLRVLIAEDDRDSAASLEALVADEGHQTRCVHRGRAVLSAVHDFNPDVVLLDIGMPGISGYDIARILRKTFRSSRPTLIAVTAWTKSADKLMAKAAGFDYHFGKPYDPPSVLALLRDLAVRGET